MALVEGLAAYVPGFLRRRFAASTSSVLRANEEHFDAAVVFSDISGFTALAERLAREGPGGAEALGRILNSCFGALVDVIHAHGGDVVKFAGDALLALWPAEGVPLELCTQRAASCGLALQRALQTLELPADQRVSLKVAIAAGPVSTLVLGGDRNRWEHCVVGAPLLETGEAGHLAQKGEVLVARSAWRWLEPSFTGDELSDGVIRLHQPGPSIPSPEVLLQTVAPGVEAQLRGFVPEVVLRRLTAGQSGWLGELRPVTALFLNLPELRTGISLVRAQRIVFKLQQAVHRVEGVVNKLSVDDKGISLLAAFGLPPHSHEDDPERAVRAAVEFRQVLEATGARGAIGVATGKAFTGVIGSARRCEYTLIGDAVNLAARLMQAAHGFQGGPLFDDATVSAASARLRFEALGSIELKGKSAKVQVHRFAAGDSAVEAPALRDQPLLGRDRELSSLVGRARSFVETGTGGAIVIDGEAGLGKTALLERFVVLAREVGVAVLRGAADAIEKTTPYFAWRGIFGGVLPEAARADKTLEILTQAVAAKAEGQRLCLIFEDAHGMDSSSWSLLRRVAKDVQNCLIVLTTRPMTERAAEASAFFGEARCEMIRLAPLAPDAAAAIAAATLRARSLSEGVARLIQHRAQGNPLFTEVLARALVETGVVQVHTGRVELVPGGLERARAALPLTLQGLVTGRIDRLPPAQQLTLKVASVVGSDFTVQTLCGVHPTERAWAQVISQLAELQSGGLIHLAPGDQLEPTYTFQHGITRDVAYGLLLFAQRRELHRAIARWFEAEGAAQPAQRAPLLAHHWTHAEEWQPAADYSELAGDQARALYAFAEAQRHYASSLDALGRLSSRAELGRRRADLLLKQVAVSFVADDPSRNLARVDEAEALIAAAGDAGEEQADRARRAQLHGWRGRIHYYRDEAQLGIPCFERMKEELPEPQRALATTMIGRGFAVLGNFRRAIPILEESLAGLERGGQPSDWIWTAGVLGGARVIAGDVTPGLALAREALARAEALKNLTGVAMCHTYLASAALGSGRPDVASEHTRTCIDIAERSGDRIYHYLGTGQLAWAQTRLGAHAQAIATFERLAELVRGLGGAVILRDLFASVEAEALLQTGDLERARTQAEEVADAARRREEPWALGMSLRTAAVATAALGGAALEALQPRFEESLRALEDAACLYEQSLTLRAWAQLLERAGDAGGARLRRQRAEEKARPFLSAPESPR